jgi:hypothetical protein
MDGHLGSVVNYSTNGWLNCHAKIIGGHIAVESAKLTRSSQHGDKPGHIQLDAVVKACVASKAVPSRTVILSQTGTAHRVQTAREIRKRGRRERSTVVIVGVWAGGREEYNRLPPRSNSATRGTGFWVLGGKMKNSHPSFPEWHSLP